MTEQSISRGHRRRESHIAVAALLCAMSVFFYSPAAVASSVAMCVFDNGQNDEENQVYVQACGQPPASGFFAAYCYSSPPGHGDSVCPPFGFTNCTNYSGNFFCSGSYNPNASCTFNGQPVAHGSGVTAYQSNNVPHGQTCQSESRTCTSGSLSGSYGYPACTVSFSPTEGVH